jgi:hypothetical protein
MFTLAQKVVNKERTQQVYKQTKNTLCYGFSKVSRNWKPNDTKFFTDPVLFGPKLVKPKPPERLPTEIRSVGEW